MAVFGGFLSLIALTTFSLRETMAWSSFHGSSASKAWMLPRYYAKRSVRRIASKSTITMMPEGPEVRNLVDQLQGGVGKRLLDVNFIGGRYVRNGKPDGFQKFAATMTPYSKSEGKEAVDVITSWQAKGKFIYILLDIGKQLTKIESMDEDFQRSIWITLGMTGKFVSEKVHAENSAHGRWFFEVFDLETEQKRKIYYHDMRNFGTLKFCLSKSQLQDKLDSLGPDILEVTTTEDAFVEILTSKNQQMNICTFLMNQKNICGVGNYILAEGLYRASLDPFASLGEFSEEQQRNLFRALQSVASESYAAQGMTRRQGGVYANVDGSKGQFEMQLQCYGRDFCPRGSHVIRKTNGPHGRTIWYTEEQLFMPESQRYQSSSTNMIENQPVKPQSALDSQASKRARTSTEAPGWDVMGADNGSNADKLLSSLSEPGWTVVVSRLKEDESFRNLADFLADENAGGQVVYPPHCDVFSALNLCPLDNVKVVIVGQDPYHGPGQGHGLAFSVKKGVQPPPSLKNIFQEAIDDVGIDAPPHGNLEHWAEQGVLLLNSVLTVRRGQANSHASRGWEDFTDTIIQHLNDNKEGLVFLLFGNPAQKKASRVDDSKHNLIRTSHPSPLGARKTASPFLGSQCFSRCNKILADQGQEPIDWNVR